MILMQIQTDGNGANMRTVLDRQKLRLKMVYAGIETYRDLAKLSDISENTLYKIVGEDNWTIKTIDSIAAALGCKSTDLLSVEYKNGSQENEASHTQVAAPFVMALL